VSEVQILSPRPYQACSTGSARDLRDRIKATRVFVLVGSMLDPTRSLLTLFTWPIHPDLI
jgi:hypothetical protein